MLLWPGKRSAMGLLAGVSCIESCARQAVASGQNYTIRLL